VVLKNRLEQFKKRQREEAAKQQQELGNKIVAEGEAATFGGDMHAEGGDGEEYEDDADDEDDFIEDYSRSMSPGPVELKTLAQEDRRLPVITEDAFKRNIVRCSSSLMSYADDPVQSEASSRCIIVRPATPGRSRLFERSNKSNSLSTIGRRSRGRGDLPSRGRAGEERSRCR
jgi:hypothetical protein